MDNRYIQFSTANNINRLMDNLLPLLTINPLDFYTIYFDIDTCEKDGLDNYGRILELSRVISINTATEGVFGFGVQSDYPIDDKGYPQNFNNGYFYNPDYEDLPTQYTMTDFEFRLALRFRYAALTTNLSLKAINKIMNNLLTKLDPAYKCKVYQSAVMQLTYSFNFNLLPWLKSLFINRNVLPVPAGVTAIILDGQIL